MQGAIGKPPAKQDYFIRRDAPKGCRGRSESPLQKPCNRSLLQECEERRGAGVSERLHASGVYSSRERINRNERLQAATIEVAERPQSPLQSLAIEVFCRNAKGEGSPRATAKPLGINSTMLLLVVRTLAAIVYAASKEADDQKSSFSAYIPFKKCSSMHQLLHFLLASFIIKVTPCVPATTEKEALS